MSRSRALILATALSLGGCDVGALPGIEPDGGLPGGPDGVAFLTCQPVSPTLPAGGPAGEPDHNVGAACMQAACHAIGGDGPTWSIAGTLYTDALGTTPNAGATVSVRDAMGTVVHMISAANGNFKSTVPVVYPVTTFTSKCPAIRPMIAQSATGDCNAAGCHSQGSASGRIWLDPP